MIFLVYCDCFVCQLCNVWRRGEQLEMVESGGGDETHTYRTVLRSGVEEQDESLW